MNALETLKIRSGHDTVECIMVEWSHTPQDACTSDPYPPSATIFTNPVATKTPSTGKHCPFSIDIYHSKEQASLPPPLQIKNLILKDLNNLTEVK